MNNVETLERLVRSLSPQELAEFRSWYAEFDAANWDAQIEADGQPGGKLARLAERALEAHAGGKSTPL